MSEETLERPTWDEFFIAIAVIYSSRGTCDRLRTSCLFVSDKRFVGAGYNGAISGLENCDEVGHLMIDNHCLRTLHGEENALANSNVDLKGATAYVIATPCLGCMKKMLQAGIVRIVYVGSYQSSQDAEYTKYIKEICRKKKVKLEQMTACPIRVAEIFEKIFARLQGQGGIFKGLDLKEILFPEDQSATIKEQ
jgi:dCMP deaminase